MVGSLCGVIETTFTSGPNTLLHSSTKAAISGYFARFAPVPLLLSALVLVRLGFVLWAVVVRYYVRPTRDWSELLLFQSIFVASILHKVSLVALFFCLGHVVKRYTL